MITRERVALLARGACHLLWPYLLVGMISRERACLLAKTMSMALTMAILTGRDDIQLTCLLVGEDDEHGTYYGRNLRVGVISRERACLLAKTMSMASLSSSCHGQRRVGIGGFGGGWLEHPGPWVGAQWAGLPWERRASQSCQARPEEAREPTSGTAKGSLWPCCP